MNRHGFVLIAMLGLLLITSSLTLAVGAMTRADIVRAQRLVDHVRAESAARAAAISAIDSVSLLLRSTSIANRDIHQWQRIDTVASVIVITTSADLAGKLHTNAAPAEELRRFLVQSGLDAVTADIASQSIADWRDGDELHRPRGAEDAWYRSNGLEYGPRNRPITTFEELGFVRGVSPGALHAFEDEGSLDGGGRINVNAAPPVLLASLPGITPEAATAIVSRRSERAFTNIAEVLEAIPPQERQVVERTFHQLAPRLSFVAEDIEIRVRAVSERSVHELHITAHHTGEGRVAVTRYWYSQ